MVDLLAVGLGFSIAGIVACLDWWLRKRAPAVVRVVGWMALFAGLAASALLCLAMIHPSTGARGGMDSLRSLGMGILWLNGMWGLFGVLVWVQARLVGDANWKRCAAGLGTQLMVLGMLNAFCLNPLVSSYLWQNGHYHHPSKIDAEPVWRLMGLVQIGAFGGMLVLALWLPLATKRKRIRSGMA
ncbi:MAG TPA: hypothetical protein VGB45_01170 [Abditibacterium sp.]